MASGGSGGAKAMDITNANIELVFEHGTTVTTLPDLG
jgi:hypothetical protein